MSHDSESLDSIIGPEFHPSAPTPSDSDDKGHMRQESKLIFKNASEGKAQLWRQRGRKIYKARRSLAIKQISKLVHGRFVLVMHQRKSERQTEMAR